jgi:hypothetical protein
MSFFKKLYEKTRDAVFGRTTNEDVSPIPIERTQRRRHDQGPAEKWYVKARFPRAVFTKKLTRCRQKQITSVLLHMRPEQREIAYRFGYNKNIFV